MYFEDSAIEEYDEDDFYYHMYFDEVSTTPLPIDDFYDILESVSAGSEPQVLSPPSSEKPPDYTDYFGGYDYEFDLTKTLNDTLEYFRDRVPRRVAGHNSTTRNGRNNGKMLRLKRDTQPRDKNALSLAQKRQLINAKKSGKRLRIKVNHKRNRVRRRKVNDPRVIGILDRRTPELFRQSPFVTISLTKFVVLSTGVTNAALLAGRSFKIFFFLFRFHFVGNNSKMKGMGWTLLVRNLPIKIKCQSFRAIE